jgi:hypothetical protein
LPRRKVEAARRGSSRDALGLEGPCFKAARVEHATSGTQLKETAAGIQGLDVVAVTWWKRKGWTLKTRGKDGCGWW